MKNKDLKKGRESIIGKIIYGFLLFMPLLAILVTCGYAMFNKNAYQSFGALNENKQENIVITTTNDFDYSKTYYINNSQLTEQKDTQFSSGYFYFNELEIILNNTNFTDEQLQEIDRLYMYVGANNYTIYYNFYTADNTVYTIGSTIRFIFKVNIRSITGNQSTIDNLNFILENSSSLYYINYFVEQQIDNVFYYSVDKVEQSNLFNWSKTTIIYTGIANTCTQLGITNTFTPMLLAYWLLISVVYILYDIILMILIILHNRIHRLQDSMS